MTTKRPITQSQRRLEEWIRGLEGQPQGEFLLDSLKRIEQGEDANIVFGINRGRGRSAKQSHATFQKAMARVLVASAIREHGLDLKDAIALIARELNMSPETLARYAQNLGDVLDAGGNFDYWDLIPKN